MSARRLAVLGLLLGLSGCGFQPLYARPDPATPGGAVQADLDQRLSRIFVDPIADRQGQLLRQALQARLGGDGDSAAQTYRLSVVAFITPEFIGIHPDNSPSRVRVTGDARWSLTTVALSPVRVAAGRARTLDGYNILDEQYFNSTLAGEATTARIAGALAERIVQELAIWFRTHPQGGAGAPAVAAPPPVAHPPGQPGFLNYAPSPSDNDASQTQTPGADGMPSGALGLQAPIGAH